ncbi:MAG: heavy-metal-associated domain-containing protein [Hyphomicrobiales bacterium]
MTDKTQNLSFAVQGMTCGGCAKAVTKVIQKSDPEARVTVDLSAGRVDVDTIADSRVLAEAISRAGYKAASL